MGLIGRFLSERNKWKEAGSPIRDPERMQEIYDICRKCPLFVKDGGWLPRTDKCGECGCNLSPSAKHLNKIAWATTSCPLETPKWGPDVSEE